MIEKGSCGRAFPPRNRGTIVNRFTRRVRSKEAESSRETLFDAQGHGVINRVGLRTPVDAHVGVLREWPQQLPILNRSCAERAGRICNHAEERIRHDAEKL